MGRVIGIDLGTTNSCVAMMVDGNPEVVANFEGSRTTPSIVAFSETGEKLVGQVAKRQAITNPERTITACKRLIGRPFESEEVSSFSQVASFQVVAGANGDAWIQPEGGDGYSPQEIAALVLSRLKDFASEFLGEPVTQAVVTVPAHFNDAQRQATKEAGLIAGLEVLRILNEPTAAALAYGIGEDKSRRIAVFDLGGGTFDISILELGDGVFEVKSTNGDTFLGGEDFDGRLVEYLAAQFEEEEDEDLRGDPMALQRLKEAAERAKHELSSVEATDVNLPFISSDGSGPKHLVVHLERQELEDLVSDMIDRVEQPCRQALRDAGCETSDIDEVILVGGMTRMPRVIEKVREIFGCEPTRGVNPDEVVAVGAAVQGAVLTGEVEDVLLLDVTPLSLGVETQGGAFTRILDRNCTIPASKKQVFSTTEDDQGVVRIHVVQGEREMAEDNTTLGRFELVGIPPAPRGVPQIEVSFSIDADGVVHVAAKDLGTGRSQGIEVTASSGLSAGEVNGMVLEAKRCAEEDQRRRVFADLCNRCDGLTYSSERTLEEFADTVGSAERQHLEAVLEKARSARVSEDVESLRFAVEELASAAHEVTEKLYAALGES